MRFTARRSKDSGVPNRRSRQRPVGVISMPYPRTPWFDQHDMMISVSVAALILAMVALYLVALGVLAFARPKKLTVFLSGFAGSPSAHYLEIVLRSLTGVAFITLSPAVAFTRIFEVIGWVLLSTSVILVFVPWRQHRRFAERVAPLVSALTPLIGLFSIAAGIALGWAVLLTLNNQ